MEFGEKLEDALKREILEETALTIHSIKLKGVKECFYSNNHYKNRHFLFMDYICRTDSSNVILNDEAEEYIWISLEDAEMYELGGFTGSLIKKITDENDIENNAAIYYNY